MKIFGLMNRCCGTVVCGVFVPFDGRLTSVRSQTSRSLT
jgi:hypothetical protein